MYLKLKEVENKNSLSDHSQVSRVPERVNEHSESEIHVWIAKTLVSRKWTQPRMAQRTYLWDCSKVFNPLWSPFASSSPEFVSLVSCFPEEDKKQHCRAVKASKAIVKPQMYKESHEAKCLLIQKCFICLAK